MDSAVSLCKELGLLLLQRKLSVAVAESCTGGLLGSYITANAGSSDYFRGGIIAYHNDVKRDLLDVDEALLINYGAVSAPVVEAMAEGVMKKLGAQVALAISGIAGPGGGTAEKPVGLVYIGMALQNETTHKGCIFTGSRDQVRQQAAREAIVMLTLRLQNR